MSYKQISDSIKKGKTVPLYFLHGEEDYYIDALTKLIENSLLTEDEKSFNLTVLYMEKIAILNRCSMLPVVFQLWPSDRWSL